VAVFVAALIGGWRFAHGNGQAVRIDYVVGTSADVALWKALLVATGAGLAAAAIVLGWALLRARLESRRYRKALVALESEVHQLRNLPAVADDRDASRTARVAAAGGGARQRD